MIRPSASGEPRMSSSGIMPLTPMATSTIPHRHGRPKLSEMTTGTSTPMAARTAARMRSADASGSTGSSVTTCPLWGPMFDASTPPLAQTKPWLVSVISTPFAIRTTRRASRRTTSSWRGSRSQRSANATTSGRGSIVVRSTIAPSAFETTFCVTTRTSSSARGSAPAVDRRAATNSPSRSSPGRISGIPSRAITDSRPAGSFTAPPRGRDRAGRPRADRRECRRRR